MSRATAPTLRLTTNGVTLISRRSSHRRTALRRRRSTAVASESARLVPRQRPVDQRSPGGTHRKPACRRSLVAGQGGDDIGLVMFGRPASSIRIGSPSAGEWVGTMDVAAALSLRRSSLTCFSRMETAMPVQALMADRTCRSGRGSSRAWTVAPRATRGPEIPAGWSAPERPPRTPPRSRARATWRRRRLGRLAIRAWGSRPPSRPGAGHR